MVMEKRSADPDKPFDLDRAVQLKRDGSSWSQLANEMKVSSATLRRILPPLLKNPQK